MKNGGLQRVAESGRDSGVSGENVGQRPSDVAKAIESAEIKHQQDRMELPSAKGIQRSLESTQEACEGVFASEQSNGLSGSEGTSGFYAGPATNGLDMSQNMRDREHTEERVAIEGDNTVRKATRGRYVRKVWRPTLIRQVIICRIYFKRKVATDENPEDFIVTPPEPSIPQIESGSFLAAPKPRKIKAIYPEPSGEGGLEGGCDERNLGRRFAGIDAIMFSSMVVERSERGMTFESQLNNVARTVDKRYEAEDSSHPVNQLHPASPTPKGSIPSNPHSNLYTALPITGDVGRKIEDPVASTNILPGIGQETAEQLSSSLLPKAENQVSTGSKKIGFLKQYFRKSKQHFPPPAGQNLPSSVPGNRSQSAKCNGGPYPPGPTGRRLRSTLKDLLKTHCRGMAGCSWESTGLGGGFVFLN